MGFEPTPTFVDQNTPVRKSSTLESGALDRSAILTCETGKIRGDLSARYRDDRYASIRTLSSLEFSLMLHNCVYFFAQGTEQMPEPKNHFQRSHRQKRPADDRGTSSNGRALDSHSRGTGINARVLHGNFFVALTTAPKIGSLKVCHQFRVPSEHKGN